MIYQFITLLFVSLACSQSPQVINHTYLYWTDMDTSRTLTVVHHSPLEINSATLHLWSEEKVNHKKFSELKINSKVNCYEELKRCIHEFKLTNLIPALPYLFKLKSGNTWLTQQKKFKTLPDNARTLTFVDGGDLTINQNSEKLLQRASSLSPDFILLGGDIVYDDGDISNVGLWDTWLSHWEKAMVTSDGFVIPIISAIGNHEVSGGWHKSPKDSTLYLKFFRQEGDQTFFVRKISKLGILMILDSGHVNTHESQIPWIKQTLDKFKSAPFKMAAYHVPLFPSARLVSDPWVREGRKYWTSLFEDHGLDLAFEHHDHALKRTHPIKNNRIDQNGVLYIGDGCMGKSPRSVQSEWYLAKAKSIEHFWLGKITKDEITLKATGLNGEIFDEVVIKSKSP